MLAESFTFLVHDAAHWEFELLVGGIEMLFADVLIGWLGVRYAWPRIKRHIHRDVQEGIE